MLFNLLFELLLIIMPPVLLVLLVVMPIILKAISISNRLNRSLVNIDEALSGIDIALTQRYDLLTKMIEVVKGYAKHEKETLFGTISLRQGMTIKDKILVNEKMEENILMINALVENYPNLKANENFKALNQAIANIEERLQASRKIYNANVSYFNKMVVVFPNSIIARKKGLTKKEFFVADSTRREDLKIEF